MITTEALRFILSRLPKGSRHIIKSKTGYTLGYIDKVLKGQRSNDRIIESAISILEESPDENQSTYERLDRIATRIQKLV